MVALLRWVNPPSRESYLMSKRFIAPQNQNSVSAITHRKKKEAEGITET
jgi:hypothetical protein